MRIKNRYSKEIIRCDNCKTEYNNISFNSCPTCGQFDGEAIIPELIIYEQNVKNIKRYQSKEKKMFNLWVKRKELELEIKKLSEDLEYHKKQEEMRIAEAVQKQRLKSNEEIAAMKLEADKRVNKASLDADTLINNIKAGFVKEKAELETKHVRELADHEQKASKDYYDKLSKALADLHQNGDKNSKFVQELALEMIKKTPKILPNQHQINFTGEAKDILDQ